MAKPEIRKLLDLSTAHLTPELRDFGTREGKPGAWGGAVVNALDYGFLLWVPDDPAESSKGGEEPVPEVVLKIQLFARKHRCDYVLFDADGPECEELESFEEGEGGPPYDAATATGMYDREEG